MLATQIIQSAGDGLIEGIRDYEKILVSRKKKLFTTLSSLEIKKVRVFCPKEVYVS